MAVHVRETDMPESVYELKVPNDWTPIDVICQIIKMKLDGLAKNCEEIEEIVGQYKNAYVLNVCGCDEVLHGDKCEIASYQVRKR